MRIRKVSTRHSIARTRTGQWLQGKIINAPKFGDDCLANSAKDEANTRRDFTQIFRNAMSSSDPSLHMSPTECSLACFMLMVAGTDTTSNSLCFTLYLLAKYPAVKEELFSELVHHMPDSQTVMK